MAKQAATGRSSIELMKLAEDQLTGQLVKARKVVVWLASMASNLMNLYGFVVSMAPNPMNL